MKVVLLLLVVVLLGSVVCEEKRFSHDWHNEFINYAKAFGKTYHTTDTYTYHLSNYVANMQEAGRLNSQNPHANFGATKFSDYSKDEFSSAMLGFKPKKSRDELPIGNTTILEPHPIFTDPERHGVRATPTRTTWDWCSAGVLTPVNDQGGCGSCWAWSVSETVESFHALKTGQLVALSAEQITDCDRNNYGCGGGNTDYAYVYVKNAGGLMRASAYPYTGGGTCRAVSGQVATVINYAGVSGGENGLYNFVSSAGGGPLSVCLAANYFQNYQGGVLTQCDRNVNHCVQMTGYEDWGTASSVWRLRNQWGTGWGENGYIRLKVGSDLCAVADWATYCSTN